MSLSPQDNLAILALAARSDQCATARDADAYVRLFTPDCTMDGDRGVVHGRDQLRQAVRRVWAAERPGTLHLTLNAVVDEDGPDPTVASVLVLLADDEDNLWAEAAFVVQVVRFTPEGWLIHSRSIHTRERS